MFALSFSPLILISLIFNKAFIVFSFKQSAE